MEIMEKKEGNFELPTDIMGDMISEIPKDVMGHVLERLPIQDDVRTSVLAKSWKNKWASISKLTFGHEFLKYIENEKSLPRSVYFQTIRNLLLDRDDNIDNFTIYVPNSETNGLSPLTEIFYLVSQRGVKELTIDYESILEEYEEDYYNLLTPLYSCLEITSLVLINCGFFRPTSFNGFSNLVSLHCESINFRNDSFQHLISNCPLLESLIIEQCSSPFSFDIRSGSLKYLDVSVDLDPMTIINASNLEKLIVSARVDDDDYYGSIKVMTKLHSLNHLCFNVLNLHIWDDILLFFNLLHAAPNLQILDFATCLQRCSRELMNALKVNMNQKLKKLETLKVDIWDGTVEEMFLIERLLALSPALKKVSIYLYCDDTTVVANKIMKFPRASPVVELKFE